MKNLILNSNPQVSDKFKTYSKEVKPKLEKLRSLILEVASNIESIEEIEETLKWGEPSYLVKKGSTIRIDWKAKAPEQYAIYFKCTSKLVSSFREMYGNSFNYENNRALIFKLGQKLPEKKLKKCIAAALQYHLLKDQPNLGLQA